MNESKEITTVETCMIAPSTPTTRQELFLSSLDLRWTRFHYNRRLLFYSTEGIQEQDAFIATLKGSLAMVLVDFYPVAGRLTLSHHMDKRVCIDCNDAGVEFIVALSHSPDVNELQADDFQPCPFFNKLAPYDVHSLSEIFNLPLLSIQVTRLSSRGIVLGFANSHVLADGHSLWHFMNSWAKCARKEPISLIPLHMRTALGVKMPSKEKAFLPYPPEGLSVNDSGTGPPVALKEPLSERYFHCSGEMIQRLKNEANSMVANHVVAGSGASDGIDRHGSNVSNDIKSVDEHNINYKSECKCKNECHCSARNDNSSDCNNDIGSDSNSDATQKAISTKVAVNGLEDAKDEHNGSNAIDGNSCNHEKGKDRKCCKEDTLKAFGFTSYEAMCAYWWKLVTWARGLEGKQVVRFGVLADMRSRLSPKLPPSYFGNAIIVAYTYAPAAEVLKESLAQTAARIHQASLASSEDTMWGMAHWLELHDHIFDGKYWSRAPDLKTVSSPRFQVYDVDYGYGRPLAVRPARTKGDGEMVLSAPRDGRKGGVDICLPLTHLAMAKLLDDSLLRLT